MTHTKGVETFGARARRLLLTATNEAVNLHSDHTGTEHFLLAILMDQAGPAYEAFVERGLTEDRVREQVLSVGPSPELFTRQYDGPLLDLLDGAIDNQEILARTIDLKATTPLSEEAANALAASRQEGPVTPELVLIEMLRVPSTLAAVIVRQMGVSPEEMVLQLGAASS